VTHRRAHPHLVANQPMRVIQGPGCYAEFIFLDGVSP
jgi:hypothetical protein